MRQRQVAPDEVEEQEIDFLMGVAQEPASAPPEPAVGPFEATPVQRARARKDAASAPGELKTDFRAEAQRAAGPKEKTEAQRIEDAQVEELFQLFGREDPSLGTKFMGGVARGEAQIAKAPELAFKARDFGLRKAAEHLRKLPVIGEDFARGIGVTREMLNRWQPFSRKLAQDLDAFGREVEATVDAVDDPRFANQDLPSQLSRALGSTVPFAAIGGPAGLIGGPGFGAVAQAFAGMAQMAVPMYEDVLAETGSEEKAWAAAVVGLGLGASDALGVGRIFAKLDRASGGTLRRMLDRVALGFVEEGFQEGGQTIGESVTNKVLTGKEIKLLDELAQGGEAAFVGGLTGAGVTGGHETLTALGERVHTGPRLRVEKPGAPKAEEEALEPRYIEMFQPEGRGATGMAPTETEAPPAAPKKGEKKPIETEEEAVEAIQAGEELELEDLQRFPGALGTAASQATEEEAEPDDEHGFVSGLKGAASAISDNLRRSWEEAIEKTGRLMPQERNSAVGRAYEAAVAAGAPRTVETLHDVLEQLTPGASELAPGEEGEAQAEPSTATEAVQAPAGTAEAPGVSKPREEIEREIEEGIRGMQEIEGEVRRGTAAAISPEMAKESEESFVDDMTGLPNERADKRDTEKLLRERAPGTDVLRFELDVDDFKAINDLLGRPVGDEAIRVIGRKWRDVLRAGDDIKLSRISGDEFTATMRVAGGTDPTGIRDRLEKAAAEALRDADLDEVAGRKIGASVGFAFAEPGEDYEAFKGRTSKAVKDRKLERAGGVERPRITTAQVAELGEGAREEFAKKRAAREQARAKAELEERGEQVPGGAFGETEPSAGTPPVSETETVPEEAPGAPPAIEIREPRNRRRAGPRPTDKAGEEAAEAQSVRGARVLIQSARLAGSNAQEVFDTLLADYQEQPKLRQRTSTSKELQQFSTPTPLAWVASQLAGIEPGAAVYEPTAGHGALLIDATPSTSHANELDPERAARLRGQGFDVHEEDATTHVPPGKYDVVIANPPFGKSKEDDETFREWPVVLGDPPIKWKTREIDHAIAIPALAAMKDNGRAVLLIAGKNPFGDKSAEARTEAYRSMEDQRFFGGLYNTYNVTDHFTVAGKLYDRMGAAWPIDFIVIDGRGRTPAEKVRPFKQAPRILETWDDVRNLLSSDRLAPAGVQPEADRGERAPSGEAGVPGVPAAARGTTGGRAGEPESQRGGQPRGKPAGSAPRGDKRSAGAAEGPSAGGVAGVDRPGRAERPGAAERGPEQPGVAEGGPEGVGERVSTEPLHGGTPGVADVVAADVARGLERANEFQSTYKPKSKGTAIGTLVPMNMQLSMDRALADIEKQFGQVDTYVAQKLGYKPDELAEAFAAEQVDALALAISNIDRGAGFVLGDQTGVGKGRVVAGMLRYAARKGLIPVFVTAKPGLFADMRRDLTDIGMPKYRQFVTNTNLTGEQALVLPDGEKIQSLIGDAYDEAIAEIERAAREKRKPKGFDAVFTTYDQMNTVMGKQTVRNAFLKAIAPNSLIVLDESHLAGGVEEQPGRKKKEDTIPRSKFFREIVELAKGVIYSSATYAKNPHVMSLYSRTDIGLAVNKPEELVPLIKSGGVPLQQVIASMLVETGQYARREKSFEGISIEFDVAKTAKQEADKATEILRALFDFDLGMIHVRQHYLDSQGSQGGGKGTADTAVGEGGAQATGFSSVMHNVIAQMLLSLKAREVGRKAVAVFRGEAVDAAGNPLPPHKPLIALSNTMEGMLKDYATAKGAKTDDLLQDFNFAEVFQRYLERMREVTIKRPDGTKVRHRLTDEEIAEMGGPHYVKLWEGLKARISEAGLEAMPGSPIDAIIAELEAGGLKVGEITGRTERVRYEGDRAIYSTRANSDAVKKRAMKAFNDGDLDALIINQSGSTGYSLHASPKNGKDARPRLMFVVQADPNIDVFMQMLGRINRTGQTVLPRYTVLVSDLPSEKRPAAILMRKMASLNANTSASRTSAVSLKQVVDFMNEYGDAATADVLRGEMELSSQIGFEEARIQRELKKKNLARRATGYLPLLKIEDQERILERIEKHYSNRLAESREKGENALEAEVHDIKAKTLERRIYVQGDEQGSPFARPVYADKVQATRIVRPLDWKQVQARARGMLDVGSDASIEQASRAEVARLETLIDKAVERSTKAYAEAYAEALKELPEGAPDDHPARAKLAGIKERGAKARVQSGAIKDRVRLILNRSVRMTGEDGGEIDAYIVGIEPPGKKDNPLAPSAWTVVVAPADGTIYYYFPVSRLIKGLEVESPTGGPTVTKQTKFAPLGRQISPEAFPGGEREVREQRWILTGNLLKGFATTGGQVVFYTTDKGDLSQGILLSRGFDPFDFLKSRPVKLNPAQALAYLRREGGFLFEEREDVFRIAWHGPKKPVTFIASTKNGKPYYLHKGVRALVGDWDSQRSKKEWTVEVPQEKAQQALELFESDLGMQLVATEHLDTAREVSGQQLPKDPVQLMAFPGSIMEDVRNAMDALANKLGYTRKQKVFKAATIPTETQTEHAIRKWQDTFRGVKTLQKKVVEEGGELRDAINTYRGEEMRRGRTKNRLEEFNSNHFKPMLRGLREDGISPEEAGLVAMARAAPARNALILARDPDNDAGSGFTDEEASEIVDKALSGKRAEGFKRFFARFDAMIEATRAGWVKDGLKSQEEVDQLAKDHPFYAPMRSDLSEEDEAATRPPGSRGVEVRGKEFKTALGRHSKAEASHVLGYAFTQAELGILRGEKNRVMRRFLNFLRANVDLLEGFAKIRPAPVKRALVNGLVKNVYDPTYKFADNVVVVHENGKAILVEIETDYQNVADALKNLGAEDIGALTRAAGAFNRNLAALLTRYSIVFPVFNAIRDAGGAFVSSQEHGMAFALNTIGDIPRAWWTLTRGALGASPKQTRKVTTDSGTIEVGPITQAKWDAYLKEYVAEGAPVSFLDLSSFTEMLRRIEKDARAQVATGTLGMVKRNWLTMKAILGGIADIFENGARFSGYVHAREDLGMTREQAASWAKNLTTNFERRGEMGATLNSWYMFLNAGIQGTARVGEAVQHRGVQKLLAAGFVGLMVWDQIMRAVGGQDADGEDCWDKIPAWEKRHNFVIMYPAAGGSCGRHVNIPLPFVYSWVQTAAFQLSGSITGDIKPGKALGEFLSAGVDAFSPLGGSVDLSDPKSILRMVSPTATDLAVELATNRDYKGDPIGPEDYGGGGPDSERYWPDKASAPSIAVTRWLNKVAGGDEFERGPGLIGEALDISPHTLDHIARFLTGGLGRDLLQIAELGQKKTLGQKIKPRDVPFVSRILKEPSRFQSTSEMHRLQDEIRAERDRAKRDRTLMPSKLAEVMASGNQLETYRAKQRKVISAMKTSAEKDKAERDLDILIQKWNAEARKALLTTEE